MINSKLLGKLAKESRQKSGLTLDEAAALCNVGRRFLIDLERGKESLQLKLTLQVLLRLGVRLIVDDRVIEPLQGGKTNTSRIAPQYDDGNWHLILKAQNMCWLDLLSTAWTCNAELGEDEVSYCFQYTSVPLSDSPLSSVSELFSKIDETSASAIRDTRLALRWIITSLLVGAVISSDSVWRGIDVSNESQLFFVPSRLEIFQDDKSKEGQGISLKGETNPEWMRADHFTYLADESNVNPKVVFEIMKELSSSVPSIFRRSLEKTYQTKIFRGKASEALKLVDARARRLRDISLGAKHQGLSGEKIKPMIDVSASKEKGSSVNDEPLYE